MLNFCLFSIWYKSEFSSPKYYGLEFLLSTYGIVRIYSWLDIAKSRNIFFQHHYRFPIDIFLIFLISKKGHFLSKLFDVPSFYGICKFIIHFCKCSKIVIFLHPENEVSLDRFIIQYILFDHNQIFSFC